MSLNHLMSTAQGIADNLKIGTSTADFVDSANIASVEMPNNISLSNYNLTASSDPSVAIWESNNFGPVPHGASIYLRGGSTGATIPASYNYIQNVGTGSTLYNNGTTVFANAFRLLQKGRYRLSASVSGVLGYDGNINMAITSRVPYFATQPVNESPMQSLESVANGDKFSMSCSGTLDYPYGNYVEIMIGSLTGGPVTITDWTLTATRIA